MMAGLVALRARDAEARFNRLGNVLRRETSAGFDRRGLPAQMTGFGSLFRLHPGRLSLLKIPSGHGIGLPMKTATDDIRLFE
jgi:hypothetical protein